MKTNLTIEELAEGFNHGTLSGKDLEAAQWMLQNNPEFAEAVELDLLVSEVVAGNAQANLRTQMSADLTKIERLRKIKIGFTTGIGICLLGAGIYYFTQTSTSETAKPANTSESVTLTNKEINQPERILTTTEKPVVDHSQPTSEKLNQKTESKIQTTKAEVETTQETTVPEILLQEKDIKIVEVTKIETSPSTNQVETTLPICNLSFETSAKATCIGQNTGTISSIIKTQGTKPYSFSINERDEVNSTGYFSDLAAGKYTIKLTDSQNCVSIKTVTISEQTCLPKSISFSPGFGETALIDQNNNEQVKLQIISRSGMILFEKEINNEAISWNGQTNDGSLAIPGTYACLLHYMNGKKESIQVSVLK